jgi:hypothetical protein
MAQHGSHLPWPDTWRGRPGVRGPPQQQFLVRNRGAVVLGSDAESGAPCPSRGTRLTRACAHLVIGTLAAVARASPRQYKVRPKCCCCLWTADLLVSNARILGWPTIGSKLEVTKTELVNRARVLGLPTTGSKFELAKRISLEIEGAQAAAAAAPQPEVTQTELADLMCKARPTNFDRLVDEGEQRRLTNSTSMRAVSARTGGRSGRGTRRRQTSMRRRPLGGALQAWLLLLWRVVPSTICASERASRSKRIRQVGSLLKVNVRFSDTCPLTPRCHPIHCRFVANGQRVGREP